MVSAANVKRLLVSGFCVLNLGTVLIANRPAWADFDPERSPSNQGEYAVRMALWYDAVYAHGVGLDNRWQMFGHQSRWNWWYEIKGRYGGREVAFPIPGQSERTFLERHFFDFKEAKFALNVYDSQAYRLGYSDYLRRAYPTHEGVPLDGVIWELSYQRILDPDEARAKGTHLDPTITKQTLDVFDFR